MKYLMLLLLLVMLPSASALNLYYNVTMTYDKGVIALDSWSVVPKEDYDPEEYDTFNDYAALIKTEDSIGDVYYFDFNRVMHAVILVNQTIVSEDIVLEKNTISAYFPYREDATQIVVLDAKSKEPLTINLKKQTEVAESTLVKPKAQETPIYAYLLVGILVLIALVVMWLAFKKDKNR